MIDSKLCLGCMSFGSSRWRPWVLDEPASLPLLDAAAELGLLAFDTANVYSGGESERILGRFLKSRGLRDKAFIATKLFHDTPDRLGQAGLGRANVIGSTEASLSRLGVDRIDLMQIHAWDDEVEVEETLEAFALLVEQGKIARFGASNLAGWQLAKAQIAAARLGLPGFSAVQPHYNLIYREDERDLIPLCQDQGIALLPWSPLARGRLARGPQQSARSATDDVANSLYDQGGGEAIIAALHSVARELGEAPASVALAWLMAKGTAPIFGATKVEQIEQAAAARRITLTPAQMQALECNYVALPQVGLPKTARNQTPTEELAKIMAANA